MLFISSNFKNLNNYYKMIGLNETKYMIYINSNYYISKSKINEFNKIVDENDNLNLIFFDNKTIVCKIIKIKNNKYKNVDYNLFFTKYQYVENPLNLFNIDQVHDFTRINKLSNDDAKLEKIPIFENNIFIIHRKKDIEREKYIYELNKLFKNINVVDGISYDENENIMNLTSYCLYRNHIVNELYEMNKHSHFTMGAIGLVLSNILVLNYAISNNLKNILIFEDDVLINKKAEELLFKYLNNIPKNTQILLLGCKQRNNVKLEYVNDYFYKENYSWGTHSYGILENSLNDVKNKYDKLNCSLDYYRNDKIIRYVSKENIFITDCDLKSSIQVNQEKFEDWKWNKNMFIL